MKFELERVIFVLTFLLVLVNVIMGVMTLVKVMTLEQGSEVTLFAHKVSPTPEPTIEAAPLLDAADLEMTTQEAVEEDVKKVLKEEAKEATKSSQE